MPVLNIAMVGSDALATEIAKSTETRDVQTYVHKEMNGDEQNILSIIRPVKYPDKLRPFLSALSVAEVGMIEIEALDKYFGEILIAFASSGISKGLYVINPPNGGWIDPEQVKLMFEQVGLSQWQESSRDAIILREEFYSILEEIKPQLVEISKQPLAIAVDQYFQVKGIGLVVIGYVQSGKVSVHDRVSVFPSGGSAEVKSLQVMDTDVTQSFSGDRVGLALRNGNASDFSNGCILTHPEILAKSGEVEQSTGVEKHMTSTSEIHYSPFQKKRVTVGDVVHASLDLQFVVGRVTNASEICEIEWENPFVVRTSGLKNILLTQLDSVPRILGEIRLIRKK
ncbi:MAG: EF-Tu/IF-2/RF-3 family GTPase [Candidatus Poseidoniaceae archaeon]